MVKPAENKITQLPENRPAGAPAPNGHTPVPGDAVSGGVPAPAAAPRVKVIKFSHVSKRFQLHQQRPNSFQEMLTGLIGKGRRLRHTRHEKNADKSADQDAYIHALHPHSRANTSIGGIVTTA